SLQARECAGGRMRILVGVAERPLRTKGPSRATAKDYRIPADRPRHPCRGRFALRAWQAFLAGIGCHFRRVSARAGGCGFLWVWR
ncbi:hypothetical protein, partial [Pantoea anthophila]|uniref:hypothetical protein n=1 Tax=Pantoea anthophila TaxID=470931 RepID=UPI003CF823F6